jgi:hypothetical protein
MGGVTVTVVTVTVPGVTTIMLNNGGFQLWVGIQSVFQKPSIEKKLVIKSVTCHKGGSF